MEILKGTLLNSVYFGVFITLFAFTIGNIVKAKLKHPLANPLIIGAAIIIAFLVVTGTPYEAYESGAKYITFLLTPATVCYAVPMHLEMQKLKDNKAAILISVTCGAITSMLCILAIAVIFGISHEHYVTLLPKSITTAMAIPLADELGGISAITTATVIITGIGGNMLGPYFVKLWRIRNRISIGLSYGTASHAVGTAKAFEYGEVEGAMSSLALVITGLVTVVAASFFAGLY